MNIEMKGINKSFGSNQVLKDAGFFLRDGEVHALMGENGLFQRQRNGYCRRPGSSL